MRDRLERTGRALLADIAAGLPIQRRDAVLLAREVLDCQIVRAAQSVLEADDGSLCARLVELLRLTLGSSTTTEGSLVNRSSSQA